MLFPLTLLQLAGSIALLLWGVHMVQTGVQRTFGARLRGLLGTARDIEARATMVHFERQRPGRTEIAETSTLHLDILSDLARVNAHPAAAAYPVLERRGELLPSRMRQVMSEAGDG